MKFRATAGPGPAADYAGVQLDDLVADTLALVRCESPTHDRGAVAAAGEVVMQIMAERLGREPEVLTFNGVPCLRLTAGDAARRSGGKVVLLTHIDTVWPVGTLADLPAGLDGHRLVGPGCFDMKAGIVIAIHALSEVLHRGGPNAVDGVTLLVTGDEETGSAATRQLIEAECRDAGAVLVLEGAGPGGALKTGRKGTSEYRLDVHGRAAHAGLEPAKGVNASVELAHLVIAVSRLGDPQLGTTVTPTMLAAGTSVNTVPEHGCLDVDVRALSELEQRRVDALIRSMRPTLEGARVEVTGDVSRPPFEEFRSAELFELAVAAARDLGLPEITGSVVGGASDGNLTAALGVPTLDGLGAVGGGAHSRDEWVDASSLPDRVALLAELIRRMCDTTAR